MEGKGWNCTRNLGQQSGGQALAAVIKQLEGNISKQMSALGIAAKGKLHKLKGNSFLCIQMNLLALWQRIIQNLVARKFEMEKIECLVQYGNHMGKQHVDNYTSHFSNLLANQS